MIQLLGVLLVMLALPRQLCHCMLACVSFVLVLHGPRSQSLYALCRLLANSACVLQVVLLTL
jgi:hypothetical protein